MGDKFKDKELVKVRTRKRPSGRRVVYLEYCVNGKQKQEYLKLFLEPEERTDRKAASHNKEVMKLVNNVKAKRTMELLENMTGMSIDKGNGKILFSDWVEQYKKEKEKNFRGKSSIKNINAVTRNLILYHGKNFRMQDINKEFCLGFFEYLKTPNKSGKIFTKVTQYTYYRVFNTMLRQAVLDGILAKNPISMLQNFEKVKAASGERVYLDISEVKKLAMTECKNNLVKRAFMFSCFCGLRFSDIEKLEWNEIKEVTDELGNKSYYLSTIMQKTQRKVAFPLSHEAMRWLPERGDSPLVFDGLISNTNGNKTLKKWAEAAGITKYVSFHVARHTFATMMLTLGADLYTTSKLLGHTNIATTQIYAKIVDKKKDEAMSLIDKFFG